jgi:hypothetical protein
MPLQECRIRPVGGSFGRPQLSAVEFVVDPTVLVLIAKRGTDGERAVGPDPDVAEVEEAMNVPAQWQSILHCVLATTCEGLDM